MTEITKQKISQCETAINLFKQKLQQYAEERAKFQKLLNAYNIRKGRWQAINADFQARTMGHNGPEWAAYWRLWLSVNPEPIKPEIPPFPPLQSQIACQECIQNMNIVGIEAKKGNIDLGGQFQMLNCVQNVRAEFNRQQSAAEAERQRKEEERRRREQEAERQRVLQKQIADLRAQQTQQEIQIRNEEEARAKERADAIRAESAARQVELDNKIKALNERLTELQNIDNSVINNVKAVRKTKFKREAKKMNQYMIITIFIYIFIVIVVIALSFVFSNPSPQLTR